ncbi:restriction endonuclease subunit S [Barnesiella intestinihominis]|uniref:restriction endonuclease subunit S n=1 Tax=Barnesiella intestinihominis TaxID=487174 RepID=UPI003AAF7316
MDIPQGYKQTELGIIPEDWEIVNLGSVAKINGRIGFRGYTTADLVGVGQGAYTIGGKHITNMVLDLHDAEYISWQKYYESPEIMVRKGDIVFAQRGTLGKSAFIVNDIGPATINPSLVLINKIKCDNEYLSYWLQCDKIVEYICSINSQTSIPMITQNQIEHIPVVLSRIKAEQQAIAEALGDIDGLIATLDKKIAKKRLIKQGAMSQLLTGKKRLPGFSDPWVEKKFSDLYRYASEGGTPDTNNMRFYANGDVPFVKIEDTETKYIESCNSFITSEGINNSSAWIVPVNSIIYTNGATIGNVSINKIPVATKQGILGIIPSSIINLEFMYYLLLSQNFKREVDSRQAKGTFATIILKSLDEIPIYLPLNQMEQIAIATILSDMDKEIADLEAQRDKYRLLKSGMMQKLLTGQIRLKIK